MIYRLSLLLLISLLLAGCSQMNIEKFDQREPKLVLEDYFQGRVYAWGIFEDRFGNLRREFKVEIDARMEGDTLILDEYFLYSDGETDRRVWRITPTAEGEYQGQADDIIGVARGKISGNALNWRYQMDLKVGDNSWRVSFDDWMYLQPGGVLINRASVKKWGLELGQVTLSFIRADQLKEAPFNLIPE
ncbi:DUF3833 domain-containing protein [Nitrincola iocasae]|jgi:hypothetical protein|uniref:DUF3833 domain-containing protein n=2 Tax=Nitrincola iocasae TaxID=2614693 RepID=A0A5J6LCD4_9GAMM|nr:DUF3833 domain-containing protein [Nitrincola iocasae]